ncbi:hypothetical protein PCANC_08904 [Puccinia coronata f. sp. avenae]|uniref:Uncharacterized protein n=1 Tax=Puccinia coronata f. sp. avenae TaxID=200324 RepID=A0A2N5VS64_9BASI|nr:hypothetical protein PCANC_08904 [Puccinia coronata f. sp. avenae]
MSLSKSCARRPRRSGWEARPRRHRKCTPVLSTTLAASRPADGPLLRFQSLARGHLLSASSSSNSESDSEESYSPFWSTPFPVSRALLRVKSPRLAPKRREDRTAQHADGICLHIVGLLLVEYEKTIKEDAPDEQGDAGTFNQSTTAADHMETTYTSIFVRNYGGRYTTVYCSPPAPPPPPSRASACCCLMISHVRRVDRRPFHMHRDVHFPPRHHLHCG